MGAVQFYVQRNGGLTVTLSCVDIQEYMQYLLGAPCCTPVVSVYAVTCISIKPLYSCRRVSRDSTLENEITRVDYCSSAGPVAAGAAGAA